MIRSRSVDERGFTLVELLVVMILIGIIGGIVTTAIVTSLQSAAASTDRVLALNELETAMQRTVRDLRSASVIEPPDGTAGAPHPGNSVTMEVFRNGSFSTVTYEIDGGGLVRSETAQVLVAEIDNTDPVSDPVFRYFDADGKALDCTISAECATARTVEIRLVRRVDDRRPIIAETRASVRNIRYRSGS